MKGGASRAAKTIMADQNMVRAMMLAESIDVRNPKTKKVVEIVKSQLREKPDSRIIVFTHYRDTSQEVVNKLNAEEEIRATKFIGQANRGNEKGLKQREQVEKIQKFRNGEYNVLVATSVGEEGLDISECSLVIFYDNVPSAIRFVQRRGRTGRRIPGRVIVFIVKGTRDEALYWAARRKVREAKSIVGRIERSVEVIGPLDRFVDPSEGKPVVYMDVRESTSIAEALKKSGAAVSIERLDVGDFVVSSEIVIERKTVEDFVRSVMDGRLFKQLVSMRENYTRPILIIQGDRRSAAGISSSAFSGALASILSDFQASIFTSSNDKETAEIIYHIARREQIDLKRSVKVREGRKPASLSDIQRYVLAGIPGVDRVLADRLLSSFGSLKEVFSASEENLKKVEGIGDKLAEKIRKVATMPYNTE